MGGSIVSGMSQRVTIGVRSSEHLERRTSNTPPGSPIPPVSRGNPAGYCPIAPDARTSEFPLCHNSFIVVC